MKKIPKGHAGATLSPRCRPQVMMGNIAYNIVWEILCVYQSHFCYDIQRILFPEVLLLYVTFPVNHLLIVFVTQYHIQWQYDDTAYSIQVVHSIICDPSNISLLLPRSIFN